MPVRRKVLQFVALVTLAISWPQAFLAEPFKLLAFGDSLVQGYGLPPNEGLVPQMQNWLVERGYDVEIINAGVAGDTTAAALQRIDWALSPEVDAAFVLLGGNDVLRGYDPSSTREYLGSILARLGLEGLPVLLVGIAAPGNYGADYQVAFQSIYVDLSNEYGTLLYPNFFSVLLNMEDRDEVLRSFYQPDGLHPNRAGVGLIVEDLGPMMIQLLEAGNQ